MSKGMYNPTIHKTVLVLSVLLALSSILNHGIFELLQGNVKTPGLFIEAIGEQHRFWVHGTEVALSIFPTFLISGLAVVLLGFFAIYWALFQLDSPKGSLVLLALFIALTLSGGGLGFLLIWLPTWIISRKIHSSLTKWKKRLSPSTTRRLRSAWPVFLTIAVASWLVVMELGVFGYFPGFSNADTILNIVFVFLFSTLIFTFLSFIGAVARDISVN